MLSCIARDGRGVAFEGAAASVSGAADGFVVRHCIGSDTDMLSRPMIGANVASLSKFISGPVLAQRKAP